MSGIVMRCMAASDDHDAEGNRPPIGCYLRSYDPEGANGRGVAEFTPHLHLALVFDSVQEAVACWRQVPASRPLREDGQPNRPLTAMTMEFVTAGVSHHDG